MNPIRIYKSGIHHGEEKIVIGNERSGMVNFSGCHLACNFCYTPETSVYQLGEDRDEQGFLAILEDLIYRGAKNLNLISPTHVWPSIEGTLSKVKLRYRLPVVLKISGYESHGMIRQMASVADVLIPDFKVYGAEVASAVNLPPNYGVVAEAALTEMIESHGRANYQSNGQLSRGILVRHLLMPGCFADSIQVVQSLARVRFRGMLNLMTYFISPQTGALKVASEFNVETLRLLAEREGIMVLVNGTKAEVKHAQYA